MRPPHVKHMGKSTETIIALPPARCSFSLRIHMYAIVYNIVPCQNLQYTALRMVASSVASDPFPRTVPSRLLHLSAHT